jgi:hypothetical protein
MDERRSEKPGRNDPCPCGADRKYKKCCERVEDERRLGPRQYEHLSVKNTVLEEIRSFREIFGVKLTNDGLEVSTNITDSDVLLFVERVRNLWGSKGDLLPQMPTKADLKFRALYFGNPDILGTVNLLARYSLYCDQIIVIDPLSMFDGMRKTFKHSPFQEPQAWVRQIVRNGVYLASLEEWIKNDLVFATAFPLSFFDTLKQRHVQEMKERAAKMSGEKWDEITRDTIESQFYSSFTPAELSAMEPAKSDVELVRRLAEDDKWWERLRPYMRGITREKVVDTLSSMKTRSEEIGKTITRLRQEPRRYEWALDRQFEPRMDVFGSGMNLLDAEWLAEITGSHLVTDRRTVWNEILADEEDGQQKKEQSEKLRRSMSALAEAFQKLEFYFLNDVPLDFALQIRIENRLVGFRTYLRDFWNKIRREDQTEGQRLATIQEFRDSLETQYQQFKKEFDEVRKAVLSKIAVAGVSGAGAILTGQLGLGIFSLGVLVAAYSDEAKKQTKHAQALSVFLDLERR